MTSVSIIECADGWPVYRERFRELFPESEIYSAHAGELPEDPDTVVITGSTSGIHDDDDWIDDLIEKTSKYIEDDVPVLGICFGHQVVVKSLGGNVERMKDFEIGYEPVEFEKSRIFRNIDDVERPFSTHQDRVVDIPQCLKATARTEKAVQGVEHMTKPVFGVQFHPELTPEISRKAIRTKDFSTEREEQLLEQVNEDNFERAKNCLAIIEDFRRISSQEIPEVRELIAPDQKAGI